MKRQQMQMLPRLSACLPVCQLAPACEKLSIHISANACVYVSRCIDVFIIYFRPACTGAIFGPFFCEHKSLLPMPCLFPMAVSVPVVVPITLVAWLLLSRPCVSVTMCKIGFRYSPKRFL